jgi:hypothetical protein
VCQIEIVWKVCSEVEKVLQLFRVCLEFASPEWPMVHLVSVLNRRKILRYWDQKDIGAKTVLDKFSILDLHKFTQVNDTVTCLNI